MSPGDREALEALQLRLNHAEAIAELIGAPLDTSVGTAVRGVAQMITDACEQLDAIIVASFKTNADR